MTDITEVIFRTVVVYIAIIIGLRILGKQHLGQITISDFVLVLLISNSVQNAMVGSNSSLIGGLIAAITLLALNFIVSKILFGSPKLRKIMDGEQVILIYDGHYQEDNLKKVQMAHEELEAIIREHGCENVSDIHSGILEMDGTISIIPVAEGKKPMIYKNHRRKHKQKSLKGF